jgi:hypothetical protein
MRETGYYHVLFGTITDSEWTIGYFDGAWDYYPWSLVGSDAGFKENDIPTCAHILEVGERIPTKS